MEDNSIEEQRLVELSPAERELIEWLENVRQEKL
jgi:hypothetical protein